MILARCLAGLGLTVGYGLVAAAVLAPAWILLDVLFLGGSVPVDGADWCGLDSDATPQSEPGCR